MEETTLLFSSRPSYGKVICRLKERLGWTDEHGDVVMQGLIDVGSSKGPRIKRLVSISSDGEWDNYVAIVLDSEVRAPDLFVQRVVRDQSPPRAALDPNDSPLVGSPDHEEVEVQVVSSAQVCEVPLTQVEADSEDVDDRSVGGFDEETVFEEPMVCVASNRVDVQLAGDEAAYEDVRAVDSDDDRPVAGLTSSEIELLRRMLPGRDPLVSDYNDLSNAHRAVADGGKCRGTYLGLGLVS